MRTGFSGQGASLKLLRSGQRGIVTRVHTLQETTAQTLKRIGLAPGRMITLEQRFPRFIIRIGNSCHSLDEAAMSAIYIRVVDH